eukprot:CAMPEP_0178943558 /NCGR_PEP_ID=MMETSP0789-20121207/2653_1 /TAXON_ID=3005 /ORGANISM="Rhizosolenia setigera, Strain CCMP 1694" /LENGTH=596 /DNA_ID=CAMNT_0020623165 /DNA_START=278 /DNA_END=2068 /DNA_ORIENTATION=+
MVYNEETQKMLIVFTSLNDTIGSLKSKIESQENIQPDLQSLLWKDNEPEDNKRLCECNIAEESVLFLRKSFITLTILNEETHRVTSLDVNPNNTIRSIKEKIEEQDSSSSVQADEQFLVWKGNELQDDRKLSEYNVEKDSFFVLKKHTVNIFDSKDQKVIILKSAGLTDTVENIKKNIESQENIPVDQQYLFFKGHEIEDDKRLSDLNIVEDSMLVLKKSIVRLKIKNEENQENMILYAERDDTIRTIKKKLEAQENISTDQRNLCWLSAKLQDDRKLSDYNFEKYPTFVLKKPLIKLSILDHETQKAIILHLDVELTDTVKCIKKKIESQESIPVDQQYLFYKGHEVEDDKDLSDLNLEKDSMLVLKKSIVRLKIRNEETQENMILYAERDDTIRSIKKKLEDQENISTDQRYLRCTIFTLYDDRRLSDYTFVKKDSLLVLKRTKIKLTILDEETQKVMTVCVYPDNTIKVVKNEIEKEKNIPADHQCLFLKENELQDVDKLSEHNIEQDSLLTLKKVLVKVNILNDNTQKLTSFDVHPYDTVKTIKKKIEDQANVPFDIQCLMWKDDELQDSKKLSEYDLEEDSLLVLKQCISL